MNVLRGVCPFFILVLFSVITADAGAFGSSSFSTVSNGSDYSVIPGGVSNWQKTTDALQEMGYTLDADTLSGIFGVSVVQSSSVPECLYGTVPQGAGMVSVSQMPESLQSWMEHGNPQGTFDPFSGGTGGNFQESYGSSYGSPISGSTGESFFGYNMRTSPYYYIYAPGYGYFWGQEVYAWGPGWGYESSGYAVPVRDNGPGREDIDY